MQCAPPHPAHSALPHWCHVQRTLLGGVATTLSASLYLNVSPVHEVEIRRKLSDSFNWHALPSKHQSHATSPSFTLHFDPHRVRCEMPFFTGPPVCPRCGQNTSRAITNPLSTPERDIGNSGRPYYKCATEGCEKAFFCFDDDRGILDTNPPCQCGRPSRRRIARKAPWDSSYLQMQCAMGTCDYSVPERDEYGGMKSVPRAEIPEWIGTGRL